MAEQRLGIIGEGTGKDERVPEDQDLARLGLVQKEAVDGLELVTPRTGTETQQAKIEHHPKEQAQGVNWKIEQDTQHTQTQDEENKEVHKKGKIEQDIQSKQAENEKIKERTVQVKIEQDIQQKQTQDGENKGGNVQVKIDQPIQTQGQESKEGILHTDSQTQTEREGNNGGSVQEKIDQDRQHTDSQTQTEHEENKKGTVQGKLERDILHADSQTQTEHEENKVVTAQEKIAQDIQVENMKREDNDRDEVKMNETHIEYEQETERIEILKEARTAQKTQTIGLNEQQIQLGEDKNDVQDKQSVEEEETVMDTETTQNEQDNELHEGISSADRLGTDCTEDMKYMKEEHNIDIDFRSDEAVDEQRDVLNNAKQNVNLVEVDKLRVVEETSVDPSNEQLLLFGHTAENKAQQNIVVVMEQQDLASTTGETDDKSRVQLETWKAESKEGIDTDDKTEIKTVMTTEAKIDETTETKTDETAETKTDEATETKSDETIEAKTNETTETKTCETTEGKTDETTEHTIAKETAREIDIIEKLEEMDVQPEVAKENPKGSMCENEQQILKTGDEANQQLELELEQREITDHHPENITRKQEDIGMQIERCEGMKDHNVADQRILKYEQECKTVDMVNLTGLSTGDYAENQHQCELAEIKEHTETLQENTVTIEEKPQTATVVVEKMPRTNDAVRLKSEIEIIPIDGDEQGILYNTHDIVNLIDEVLDQQDTMDQEKSNQLTGGIIMDGSTHLGSIPRTDEPVASTEGSPTREHDKEVISHQMQDQTQEHHQEPKVQQSETQIQDQIQASRSTEDQEYLTVSQAMSQHGTTSKCSIQQPLEDLAEEDEDVVQSRSSVSSEGMPSHVELRTVQTEHVQEPKDHVTPPSEHSQTPKDHVASRQDLQGCGLVKSKTNKPVKADAMSVSAETALDSVKPYTASDTYQAFMDTLKPPNPLLRKKKKPQAQEEEMQQKLEVEMRMRDGTARLLAAAHHPGQQLEAGKSLLTINSRMLGYMSELQRLKTTALLQHRDDLGINEACRGQVSVSGLRIPLMWKEFEHFKSKSDKCKFAVFCLIRLGTEIFDTELETHIDRSCTDITFDQTFAFANVKADFVVKIEVYVHRLSADDLPVMSAQHKLRRKFTDLSHSVGKRLSGIKEDVDLNSIVGPRFDCIAETSLLLADVRGGLSTYSLTLLPCPEADLPLFGTVCCQLSARPLSMDAVNPLGNILVRTAATTPHTYWTELKAYSIQCWPCYKDSLCTSPALRIGLAKNTEVIALGDDEIYISTHYPRSHAQHWINVTPPEPLVTRLNKLILDRRTWDHVADMDLEVAAASSKTYSKDYQDSNFESPLSKIIQRHENQAASKRSSVRASTRYEDI